jgi:hypothetical protein
LSLVFRKPMSHASKSASNLPHRRMAFLQDVSVVSLALSGPDALVQWENIRCL